jgi:FkbM family methyltransferase
MVAKLINDLFNLYFVCGFKLSLKWLINISANLTSIYKQRNLLIADALMGCGPFQIQMNTLKFSIGIPPEAKGFPFSGIREMYARNVYLADDFCIKDGALVLDLGANMGNFTNLALAHHDSVTVIAIEPSLQLNQYFDYSLNLNGWRDRALLLRGFIGMLPDEVGNDDSYKGARVIAQNEILSYCNGRRIDFMKCDIEGGEYHFLTDHRLLDNTDMLAIEIHAFAGKPKDFILFIKEIGFNIKRIKSDPDGTCTCLAYRN